MSTSRVPLPGALSHASGPARRPVGRLARQRRPAWISAGVALVALALLTNVYLFRASSHRDPVVRVVRDVPIGQQIARADLSTVRVALDGEVSAIPGRELAEVVGRHAAVDLRRGSLLTPSQVTTALTPQPGQALVTIALKSNEIPPHGLAAGSKVRLVATAGEGEAADGAVRSGTGQSGPVSGKEVPASVDSVGGPDSDGAVTISLLVADADSSTVAREASAGRIALVVITRGA